MALSFTEVHRVRESLKKLEGYCRKEEYKGWDPYDGLNSRVFNSIPLLKRWDFARLAWIQLFKRNPVNLRKLALIPKGFNPKGIALLLSGYCNLLGYHRLTGSKDFGDDKELLNKIKVLSDLLLSLRSPLSAHGSSWGYNFDWQARRLFFFPASTPTAVVTAFCVSALLEAYKATDENKYLDAALSSSDFVLSKLHRTQKDEGFLFSYSPLSGNDTVYNASLLGTRILSQCYHYTKDENQLVDARASASACVAAQNADGSWYYGELPVQKWIDSFHSGYNLEALITYRNLTGDESFSESIGLGFRYYLDNFFLPDGTPKYYHNKTYPVDIHCPAQLIVTLCSAGKLDEYRELAEKVLEWTIANMQDRSGYFYYQKNKAYTNKISYMRWSNAFMFNALSLYLLNSSGK